MAYNMFLSGIMSTLSEQEPRKGVQLTAPDLKNFNLPEGADPTLYADFLSAMNSLGGVLKFMPGYDQMTYQYGDPLLLLGRDDEAVKSYINSLLEFSNTASADPAKISAAKTMFSNLSQPLPGAWDMETLMAARDVYLELDADYSANARIRAARYIQYCKANCPFGAFSKQTEIINSGLHTIYDGTANPIALGHKRVVAGSEKFYVGSTETPLIAGYDYTIDYDNATGSSSIKFLNTVIPAGSDVFISYKYWTDTMLGEGMGVGYSNIDFSPEAFDWNLIDDENLADASGSSVIGSLNTNFWSQVKSCTFGDGMSFYEIAKKIGNGTMSFSAADGSDAFNLMCAMLETRERVFGTFKSIFGDYTGGALSDTDVINNMNAWLTANNGVDLHNFGALRMFFSMATDFINTLDAFMNFDTYWGGDLTTKVSTSTGPANDLGGFYNALMTGVNAYITSLAGDTTKQSAAAGLKAMWQAPNARWDKVGGKWTGELVNTTGSWVQSYTGKMREYGNKDYSRLTMCRMHNRSEKREYDNKMERYNERIEALLTDELAKIRAALKKKAGNKKAANAFMARRQRFAASLKKISKPHHKPVKQTTVKTPAASHAEHARAEAAKAKPKPKPKPAHTHAPVKHVQAYQGPVKTENLEMNKAPKRPAPKKQNNNDRRPM